MALAAVGGTLEKIAELVAVGEAIHAGGHKFHQHKRKLHKHLKKGHRIKRKLQSKITEYTGSRKKRRSMPASATTKEMVNLSSLGNFLNPDLLMKDAARKQRKKKRTKSKKVSAKKSGHSSGGSRRLRGSSKRLGGSARSRRTRQRLNDLADRMSNTMGHLRYLDILYDHLICPAGECEYESSIIEHDDVQAALVECLRYNVATNAFVKPQTVDLTISQKFKIKKVIRKCYIRNNGTSPAAFRMYCVKATRSNNITPKGAIIAGFADNPGGALDLASVHNYPNDSALFKKFYNTLATYDVVLHPGESKTVAVTIPEFNYDPSVYDSDSDGVSKDFSYGFLVRLQGVLCHDDTDNNIVGFAPAWLDFEYKTTWIIDYDAGAPVSYKVINGTPGTVETPVIGDNNAPVLVEPST